ncbi:hypothetical protein RB195_001513 [Necator americanus]|uniref:Uncharacterized protein n=1 Tax=Necator americanus TaxID=51031 RepID=A0ABR1DEN5_NECAM
MSEMVSLRPLKTISIAEQPIELVDKFCYLDLKLKNSDSYATKIQWMCIMPVPPTTLWESLWSLWWKVFMVDSYYPRSRVANLSYDIRFTMLYGSDTWAVLKLKLKLKFLALITPLGMRPHVHFKPLQ